MNIYYCNASFFPGVSANKLQRINMANAFASDSRVEKVLFYFIVNKKSSVKKLKRRVHKKVVLKPILIPTYFDVSESKSSFLSRKWIGLLNMYVSFWFLLLFLTKNFSESLVYMRGKQVIFSASLAKSFRKSFSFFFEAHNLSLNASDSYVAKYKKALHRAKRVITISEYTKNNWVQHGILRDKIIVLSSGVDLKKATAITASKSDLRLQLGLPTKKKIALYFGHLYAGRGIEEILTVSKDIKDCFFVIVGGTKEQVLHYKEFAAKNKVQAGNVVFMGMQDHEKFPLFLKSADVLLAPYSKKCSTVHNMSPIKLFEYMASKTPMIVPDLPRIKEIVGAKEANFFRADDLQDFKRSIDWVFDNYDKALVKAQKAFKKVQGHSWKMRVKKILDEV